MTEYSNFWFTYYPVNSTLVSLPTSPVLCDYPTLGNYRTGLQMDLSITIVQN